MGVEFGTRFWRSLGGGRSTSWEARGVAAGVDTTDVATQIRTHRRTKRGVPLKGLPSKKGTIMQLRCRSDWSWKVEV